MKHSILYFNMKSAYGTETVDQICKSDFSSGHEYRKEKQSMLRNYHLCGMPVYLSQRCTKDWKK